MINQFAKTALKMNEKYVHSNFWKLTLFGHIRLSLSQKLSMRKSVDILSESLSTIYYYMYLQTNIRNFTDKGFSLGIH